MNKKNSKKATIIVHSGDFDKVMSAYIIGNGYLSMGHEVTLFFTFWGLNALKKNGFRKLPLSKYNFFGLGRLFMNLIMKSKNVANLEYLAQSFKELGGKIVACDMTMDIMGIKKSDLREEFIDIFGTVGRYCHLGSQADINLFI